MRSRLLRKIGSLIGLLAILMSTLAPTVSQALAANTRFETMLSVYCSASSGLQTQAGNHTDLHQAGIGHWETCGYCNLAAHVPILLPLLATKLPLPAQQSRPLGQPVQRFAPYAPVFAAQPRAPPAST
jgi:Protein of unknown function (DUF2946)